jgi:hypothetical protein
MTPDQEARPHPPRWFRRHTKKAAIVAAVSVSAVGLLGGGLAYATTSSSGTVYTACVSQWGHALYNVTTDGTTPKCHGRDATITWNQTGPQGAQGPAGVAGPQGAKGDTGATGAVGPAGPAGPAGLPGLKGDTGAIGPVGPNGDTGATGATGQPGPAGPKGAIGPAGPAGTAGVYTVASTESFPGGGTYDDVNVSCKSPSDLAISGGDVPVGLAYNATAAAFNEYVTAWSGPADNNTWTWHFYSTAPQAINMEFVVYCQKG